MTLKNIFTFENYRTFLKETFESLKVADPNWTHQRFAKESGLGSPTLFNLVLSGKRNLTEKTILQISQSLGMTTEESQFFEALVKFNQAKDPNVQTACFHKLCSFKSFTQIHTLEKHQQDYFSNWYHVVIRELVRLGNLPLNPEWISAHLLPTISVEKVAAAFVTLSHLGVIQKDAAGKYVSSTPVISSGSEFVTFALKSYHRQMIERASQSIERIPRDLRDITNLTFPLPEGDLPEIKKLIQDFRQKLVDILVDKKSEVLRIYQLNVQLFPLTEKIQKEQTPS